MSSRVQRLERLLASLTKFGLVGAVGFVVDLGVFNLLSSTILSSQEVHFGPMIAKVISTTLAILTNWLGNRNWTFRAQKSSSTRREMIEFFLVSVATMPVGLLCLWVSHYLMGYTSLFADNISANIVGTVLGALLRYVLYRGWVFNPERHRRRIAHDQATTMTPDSPIEPSAR